jgi:imidazolonepropionase-like amidohydrolase
MRELDRHWLTARILLLGALVVLAACGQGERPIADLVITGGALYSFNWGSPGLDGTPAANAPFDPAAGWHPDATAIAMAENEILFVGDDAGAEAYVGMDTRVIRLEGETVLPGLVDSHTHVAELGRNLARIDLVDVETEEEAIRRVVERAATSPAVIHPASRPEDGIRSSP